MNKNRSRSPVTGLRKIAKDAKQGSAIRQRLATELKELALKAPDDGRPLHIRTRPDLTYSYAGAVNRVTPAQVETFGLELVNKDILKDVAPHGEGGLLFYPTKQGLMLLTRGSNRVSEAPRAVFTNDVRTRQKPVARDKAASTTIMKPSANPKAQLIDQRRPERAIKIDVSRAIQDIETVDPSKLIAIWENAHRILVDDQKKAQHAAIRAAISAIEAEWKRRNASGEPEQYFEWPSTEVRRGGGELTINDLQKDGVLSKLNYHVGISQGQPEVYRRRTLAKAFEGPLALDLPIFEMELWGPNKSAKRLRKIAYSIATFVKNAKGRNPIALDVAIKQWEADLRFLHDRYYVGRFDFPWPSTMISDA
ncbi:hypothetical protein [Ensifer aridi]|uniref:hypothetical protein n=1 Tax=Ensifer aridi TaxID=1708715 RepID=UPI000A110AD6|nr:hypothetical protein [Ensifer aridi]